MMNSKQNILFVFIFLLIIACQNINKEEHFVPINFDFNTLNLHLHKSIHDSSNTIDWKWSHMLSDNGIPDSIGREFYMNFDQPLFIFNNSETLPSLFIETQKNRIVHFSANIIFDLPNKDSTTIATLLDSIQTFDLLKNDSIKKQLIQQHYYIHSSRLATEEIKLNLDRKESPFDGIQYRISSNVYKNQ